jgi:hypothetical protein
MQMKRLPSILLIGLAGLAIARPALSDIVSFNPNNSWEPKSPLIWTGKLVSLGRDGVAIFEFQNGASVQSFSVHQSRIYSLAFNDDSAVGRPFPPTRADLTRPLPSDSASLLELSSSASLPFNQLAVRGGREGAYLTVVGELVSMHDGVATIRVLRTNGSDLLTFVTLDKIRLWVRGID